MTSSQLANNPIEGGDLRQPASFSPQDHPIWHPCSQMKDYVAFPPRKIARAAGSYLYTATGDSIIDAISSWWCKPLGHNHPQLQAALHAQCEHFEHVLLANMTFDVIEELSAKLLQLTLPPMSHVFYSGDGSSAIEIALKMSLQFHAQTIGPHKRTTFAYLSHAYHGENLFSLSVSDLGLYKNPFASLCPRNVKLPPYPFITGRDHPYWGISDLASNNNNTQLASAWHNIAMTLDQHAEKLAAIIVEPIVHGAGGMQIYPPSLLRNLRTWSKKNGVHLIADEIMTGLGRTGPPLASSHAQVTPDILVLMKGLSAGFLPFSAILTHKEIYNAFYADWETHKAFIHSNTYSGNALGAAVALAALKIYEDEDWFNRIQQKELTLRNIFTRVAEKTGVLTNVRGIGWLAAAQLAFPPSLSLPRPAYTLYQECVHRGLLLRPLGETVYLLPPFNIKQETLQEIEEILLQAIASILKSPPQANQHVQSLST